MLSRSPAIVMIVLTLISTPLIVRATEAIHLHLPRQVRIEDSTITLDQVCAVRGPQAQVSRINHIKLGRLFSTNQTFIVDRAMLISRLVSQGIDPQDILVTRAAWFPVTI